MPQLSPVPLLAERYSIVRLLSESGARRVWLATDELYGHQVVLKGEYTNIPTEIRQEFSRLTGCPHPRLPRAFDLGHTPHEHQGFSHPLHYFTQEWIPGEPLTRAGAALDPATVSRFAREVLELIAFLHQRQWTRLDLKPEHFLFSEQGWRLIDLDQAQVDAPLSSPEYHGTLAYLAPEVFDGHPGGPQADLYSLGAILYEVLSGRPPQLKGQTLEEIRQHLEGRAIPPLPPEWAQRDPKLVDLVSRLLSPVPSLRPVSAEDAFHDLEPSRPWQQSCPLPEGPMLGQDHSRISIETARREASIEKGGGWVVVAPPRGGRSRFLRSLIHDWQVEGLPAIYLAPVERQRGLPLSQTLLSFLERLVGCPSAAGTPPDGLAETPQYQELRDRWVASQTRQIIQAAQRVCKKWEMPVPIAIDDVEDLDDLSTQVLERLMSRLPDSGLFLVVGWNGDRAAPTWLRAQPQLVLAPLAGTEMRCLVEDAMGPGVLSADALARLTRMSQGRPGWAREALQRRWQNPEFDLETWSPQDSAGMATALLAPLSPDARALAQCLAVLDMNASLDLLQIVRQVDFNAAALGELVYSGLLLERGTADAVTRHYSFHHEPERRAIEASIDPERRRGLHLRIAEALEQQALVDGTSQPADIARHFLAAEASAGAIPYLQRAAEVAKAALRLEEAAQHLTALLALSPHGAAHRASLLLQLGEAHLDAGNLSKARAALQEALQGTHQDAHQDALQDAHQDAHQDRPETQCRLTPTRQAQALGSLGRTHLLMGALSEARQKLEAALKVSGAQSHPGDRIRWWQQLAWVGLELGDSPAAITALQHARDEGLPEKSRLEVDQIHLESSLELRAWAAPEQLVEALERGLTSAHGLGYRKGALKLLNAQVQAFRIRGELERIPASLEQLIRLAREDFDLHREATATHNLGLLYQSQGDSPAALAQFEAAARLYHTLGNGLKELLNHQECAGILLEHGRMERAGAVLERTRTLLEALAEAQGDAQQPASEKPVLLQRLLELRLCLKRGQFTGIESELKELERQFEALGEGRLALESRHDRMTVALAEGRTRDVLKLLSPLIDTVPNADTQTLWAKMHGLAMEAHRRLTPESAPGVQPAAQPVGRDAHESREGGTAPVVRLQDQAPPSSNPSPILGLDPLTAEAEWLTELRHLLSVAGEGEALAAELASMVGRRMSGRGLVFLFEGHRPMIARSYRMIPEQFDDISSTIIDRVRESRQPLSCPDVLADMTLGGLKSLRAARVRSVLCHPILRDNACLGVVYVDHLDVGKVSTPQASVLVRTVAELASELLGASLRRQVSSSLEDARFGLVGSSPPMQRLQARLKALAESRDPDLVILLLGETGTGKTVIARTLHHQGTRREGPFVPVNAAAIPDTLFESLMFGHARGAFTGAHTNQPGWFELARGGTLFLDEVGELPLLQQPRLLESLGGNRVFRRLGDAREQAVDLHLICATNRNLKEAAAAGNFRQDLLRRIQINTCLVPSLRDRGKGDIHLLATHLLHTYLIRQGLLPSDSPIPDLSRFFSRPALDFLYRYDWPWNVSELENLFRDEGLRCLLRTVGREKVDLDLVQEALHLDTPPRVALAPAVEPALPLSVTYQELETWHEREKSNHIARLHRENGGSVTVTARVLGCSRDLVYKYLGKGKGEAT